MTWQAGGSVNASCQREIRPERHMFFAAAWGSSELMTAAYVDNQFLLRLANGTTHPLTFQDNISMLKFSPSGDALAALQEHVVKIQHLLTPGQTMAIPCRGQLQTLAISNHGAWVLTVEQDREGAISTVCVWDGTVGQLCWELTAHPCRQPAHLNEVEITLKACQGLSEIERAYWRSRGIAI